MFVKNIPIGNIAEISASAEQTLQNAGVPADAVERAKAASARFQKANRIHGDIDSLESSLRADRDRALAALA